MHSKNPGKGLQFLDVPCPTQINLPPYIPAPCGLSCRICSTWYSDHLVRHAQRKDIREPCDRTPGIWNICFLTDNLSRCDQTLGIDDIVAVLHLPLGSLQNLRVHQNRHGNLHGHHLVHHPCLRHRGNCERYARLFYSCNNFWCCPLHPLWVVPCILAQCDH